MDADVSMPSEPTAKPEIPAEIKVEIQRHSNELRREFLNDWASSINWWLAVIAIVLTAFGIAIPIAAFTWGYLVSKNLKRSKPKLKAT